MKKILITGANGMLGSEAVQIFSDCGYQVIKGTRENLDITNRDLVNEFFAKNDFDFVFHAASYTKVDEAEKNRDLAFLTNDYGSQNVAIASNRKSIPIIYIGTDYVFDGKKTSPYLPSDETNPLNVYGLSKLAGEEVVKKENSKYYIVRTSWLYGKHGKNFVDTMINLSKSQTSINVVGDQFGCPTSTVDLVDSVKNLIENKSNNFGVYHLCGSGSASWYDFAKEIFNITKSNVDLHCVTSDEFPRPALRPKYSTMDNNNLMPNWRDSLRRFVEENYCNKARFRIINFDIKGDNRGSLVSLESQKNVPFDIKRVYYIFGSNAGIVRGLHAHKNLSQILIAVSGSCEVLLDDGLEKISFNLNSPNKGLLIESMIWREMSKFSPDCVLMVLASDFYQESDYIRSYDDFCKLSLNK